MSDQDRSAIRALELEHERSRTLVSWSIDEELTLEDSTWLAQHLGSCAECREAAADLRALHEELRSLPLPEIPRDLWARTSAGLDRVDRERARRAPGSRWSVADLLSGFGLASSRWTRVYAGAVAIVIVVAVVGVSLFTRSTATPASSTGAPSQFAVSSSSAGVQQAALTVVGDTSYWVAPVNGVYQIRGASTQCTGTTKSCTLTSGNPTVLGSVQSDTPVTVAISPNASNAAVWNEDKVVILPLTTQPATVSIDSLTPLPVATPVPTVAPTPQPTPTPQGAPTPGASEPGASSQPTESPIPTAAPATETPPTPSPLATPASTPSGTQPTAILSGYNVVGRSPEFSADGQWVAFSARQTGRSSGSDVFVWHQGWQRALPIRTGHGDLFAGWAGSRVLISTLVTVNAGQAAAASQAPADTSEPAGSTQPGEAPEATPTSQPTATPAPVSVAISEVYDPISGTFQRIDEPMFLPVVDPTGHFVVYWSGTVSLDPSSGLWVPGQGSLYFADWSGVPLVPDPQAGPTGTPAATEPSGEPTAGASTDASQTPAALGYGTLLPALAGTSSLGQPIPVPSVPHSATGWIARWDATGQYVAIWVAKNAGGASGQVTVMNVIPGSAILNAQPLMTATARSNMIFDHARFIYTAAQSGGDKTIVFALPPVPPAPSAQPTDTPAPPELPSPSSSLSPLATDQAGS